MRSFSLKALFFSVALIVLAGCSNPLGGDVSKVESGHNPGFADTVQIPEGKTSEFVPASTRAKPTVNGKFLVDASLTSMTNKIKQTTSPRAYQIYSNVQGQFVSRELGN